MPRAPLSDGYGAAFLALALKFGEAFFVGFRGVEVLEDCSGAYIENANPAGKSVNNLARSGGVEKFRAQPGADNYRMAVGPAVARHDNFLRCRTGTKRADQLRDYSWRYERVVYGIEQEGCARLDLFEGSLQRAELPCAPLAIDHDLRQFGYKGYDAFRVRAQHDQNLGSERTILDGNIQGGFLSERRQGLGKGQSARTSRRQNNWNNRFVFAHARLRQNKRSGGELQGGRRSDALLETPQSQYNALEKRAIL